MTVNASGTATIVAAGRNGGNCMRFTGSTANFAYARKTLPASSTWVVGFALKASAFPTGATVVTLAALLDSGSQQCGLHLASDGLLSVTRTTNVVLTGGTSSVALAAGSS